MSYNKWALQPHWSMKSVQYTQADYAAATSKRERAHRKNVQYKVHVTLEARCPCCFRSANLGCCQQQSVGNMIAGLWTGQPKAGTLYNSVEEAEMQSDEVHHEDCDLPQLRRPSIAPICPVPNTPQYMQIQCSADNLEETAPCRQANPALASVHQEDLDCVLQDGIEGVGPPTCTATSTGPEFSLLSAPQQPSPQSGLSDDRQLWDSSAITQLLKLGSDHQLSWSEVGEYFPGRSQASISQQYHRLRKKAASASVKKSQQVQATHGCRNKPAKRSTNRKPKQVTHMDTQSLPKNGVRQSTSGRRILNSSKYHAFKGSGESVSATQDTQAVV